MSLEGWARRPKTAQALPQTARIILACGQSKTNTVVAQELHLVKPGSWGSGQPRCHRVWLARDRWRRVWASSLDTWAGVRRSQAQSQCRDTRSPGTGVAK